MLLRGQVLTTLLEFPELEKLPAKSTSSSPPHSAAIVETVASLTTLTLSSSKDPNPECRLAVSGRTHSPALFLKSSLSDRRYGSDAGSLCVSGCSDETKAKYAAAFHCHTMLRSCAVTCCTLSCSVCSVGGIVPGSLW